MDQNSCSFIRNRVPQSFSDFEGRIESDLNSTTPTAHQSRVGNIKRNKERNQEDHEIDIYDNIFSRPPTVETKMEKIENVSE